MSTQTIEFLANSFVYGPKPLDTAGLRWLLRHSHCELTQAAAHLALQMREVHHA